MKLLAGDDRDLRAAELADKFGQCPFSSFFRQKAANIPDSRRGPAEKCQLLTNLTPRLGDRPGRYNDAIRKLPAIFIRKRQDVGIFYGISHHTMHRRMIDRAEKGEPPRASPRQHP